MARAAQPPRHHRERVVAGQETGDQQYRAAAPGDRGGPPEGGIAQQAGELEARTALPPQRRQVTRKGGGQAHELDVRVDSA